MRDSDLALFADLFKRAVEKCFGRPLNTPLSESESSLLSNRILEETGLVIGWKSIKNYSVFVLHASPGKRENPTVATLDTLARYVLGAPRSDEIQRQKYEGHFPYWFKYRESRPGPARRKDAPRWYPLGIGALAGGAILIILLVLRPIHPARLERFEDDFHSLQEDSLASRGWMIARKDTNYWGSRGVDPSSLTLYTLRGDNWPNSSESPVIRNLLFRKIACGCLTAEVHLSQFIPRRNWQQAGIVLLEDTAFVNKGVRLSLAYNDFWGGFRGSKEILVQAITSMGKGYEKPEEVAHKTIFILDQNEQGLVVDNLRYAALRIEKQGRRVRFLYSAGSMENAAFKEVASREFAFDPRYVGLFALRGFVDDSLAMPAHFTFFSLTCVPCDQ